MRLSALIVSVGAALFVAGLALVHPALMLSAVGASVVVYGLTREDGA